MPGPSGIPHQGMIMLYDGEFGFTVLALGPGFRPIIIIIIMASLSKTRVRWAFFLFGQLFFQYSPDAKIAASNILIPFRLFLCLLLTSRDSS